MEQPCYKCGQTVEEGRVFCPHCGAPQIRVLVAEPVPATILSPTTETAIRDALPPSQTVPVLALPVQWSQVFKPCILGALVSSLMMGLGLYPLVAMPCAGFLAVVFYRQGQSKIRTGAAARIGAFSGLLSSGFFLVITALGALIPEFRAKIREQILDTVQKSAAAHTDNPIFQQLVQQLKTPDGFVLVLVISCAFAIIFSLVLGAAGGALAGAIFRRREH